MNLFKNHPYIETLSSREYTNVLDCIAKNNPPASIKKNLQTIRDCIDVLMKINLWDEKDVDFLINHVKHMLKFTKASTDANFIRFILKNCPEEFILHTIAAVNKTIPFTESLIKDLYAMKQKKSQKTKTKPKQNKTIIIKA